MHSPRHSLSPFFTALTGFVFLLVLGAGCTKPADSCSGLQSATGCVEIPGLPTPTPTPTNPPVGVVDDSAGFYLHYVTSDKYTYDLHKGDPLLKGEGGYGTDCTAVAGEAIDCYLEAEELDLWFNGVTLQYNVPSTMCEYVRWTPFYYYQYPVDRSPPSVYQHTDMNGAAGFDLDEDGVIEPGTEILGVDRCVDLGGLTGVVCTGCPYDYSAGDGPNCCQGNYSITTRAWNATDSKYNPPATVASKWTGTVGACLGGPATKTQPKSKSGYPYSDIYYVDKTGVNKTYEVKSPLSLDFGNNLYVSNFSNRTPLPVGLDGQVSIFGPAFDLPPPSATYYVQCLDRSEENIATIKMHIREWNTQAAFDARIASPANYDVTGFEPAPFGSDPLNDNADWDDIPFTYPYDSQ